LSSSLAGVGPIILASRSPRRIALIEQLGLEAIVRPSSFNEHSLPEVEPIEFARSAAQGKADAVARLSAQDLVVGMDTVVHLEGRLLGKARDEADAQRMLRMLSGRRHCVTTGVALIDTGGGATWLGDETSLVEFKLLSDEQIAAYLATGEFLDKAGAYGIQGQAAAFIAALHGDYFNVVGFPVRVFLEGLSNFRDVAGLTIPSPPSRFQSTSHP
jgi:septum formation protein